MINFSLVDILHLDQIRSVWSFQKIIENTSFTSNKSHKIMSEYTELIFNFVLSASLQSDWLVTAIDGSFTSSRKLSHELKYRPGNQSCVRDV